MSNFKSRFEQEMKNKRINEMSPSARREIKYNSLMSVVKDIDDRKNRYIFYCPDIAVVNPLVKMVYDIAYNVQQAGYNAIVLHEMNPFKAKWLYDSEEYKEYRKIPVEYILNKSGRKSKKESNLYTFKPADTLIVTDAFQDMLENLANEKSLTLIQKVVLITGYMGIKSLTPGSDYTKLGVNTLIFFEENVKLDYEDMFSVRKTYIMDNYPVNPVFNSDKVELDNIYPVIGITSIGNNDTAQQLINIFYNKFPNLSMFTFKIISRDSLVEYIDNVTSSAAIVMLDKDVVTKQSIFEIINTGTPVFLTNRREYYNDKALVENFLVDGDMFDLATRIAEFCKFWLTIPNSTVKDSVMAIADSIDLKGRTMEGFSVTVSSIFDELQLNRRKTFQNLKEVMDNESVV